jgi:2-keto-3-deoxy-L-rhamnonate aldolase RhmA
MSTSRAFRERLRARDLLVGTFVKTPHPSIVEALAPTGLDCLCLDAEHAPFDRGDLDLGILAARATGQVALVRPASAAPDALLNALDLGAAGVLVPHVRTAQEAAAVVASCRYGPGGRGYAGSTRAAGYGARPMPEHLARSAEDVCVIGQIEDLEALDEIDAIVATPGLDAIFIGRIDLTVALEAPSPLDPRVIAAVQHIVDVGAQAGVPVGMFTPAMDEIAGWRDRGASLFLLASDHAFIQAGARGLAAAVRGAKASL